MCWEAVNFQTDIVLLYGLILWVSPLRIVFQNPAGRRKITVIQYLLELIKVGRL